MNKNLCDMDSKELLNELIYRFTIYDGRRDDELDFLSKHPNKDCWYEYEMNEYKDILNDINESYNEIYEIIKFVNNKG